MSIDTAHAVLTFDVPPKTQPRSGGAFFGVSTDQQTSNGSVIPTNPLVNLPTLRAWILASPRNSRCYWPPLAHCSQALSGKRSAPTPPRHFARAEPNRLEVTHYAWGRPGTQPTRNCDPQLEQGCDFNIDSFASSARVEYTTAL